MSFPRLFSRFILRALLREKTRSVVAGLGIALGVAVFTAVRLANSSVTETFRTAVDSISGQVSLRIRGPAGRFDERLLAQLDWLHAWGRLSPVVETVAMVAERSSSDRPGQPFPRGDVLHVLGVDMLLDFPLREYHVLRTADAKGRSTAREILALLDDPRAVILTEKFLRRHGLRVGDQVPLVFDTRELSFNIRGVLLDRGPARVLDGNFALMDIAAAQLAAERLGVVDYVDLLLPKEIDPDQVLAEIRGRLPAELVAELPDAAYGRGETMVSAFQFNLTALSTVSLVVGLFLIYNTVSISVASRRAEIGMLQAVGAGRVAVLSLFLAEAVLLAACGVVVGLPLGRLLAGSAVHASAQTVETFYIAAVADSSAAALRLSRMDYLLALAVALPLSMLAAAVPAWEAASVRPVEAIRGLASTDIRPRLRRRLGQAAACCAAGWVLTYGGPVGGKPVWGFLAVLCFLFGGSLATPFVLWATCQTTRRLSARWLPRAGLAWRLAAANLLAALPRVAISVAALSVSLAMMVAIAVMVGSFRNTVVYWLDSVLSADLAVRPVMQTSSVSEARLSEEAVRIFQSDPDVAETLWFSSRQIPYAKASIRLAATELAKTVRRGRVLFKSPPGGPSRNLETEPDGVVISESLAIRCDKDVGDTLELPASPGTSRLKIVGVYYDYSSNQGTVLMDAATYRRHFASSDPHVLPQNLSIFLRPNADVERVRARLLSALGPNERLYCVTNSEVRREALRIFESTFTITYALQVIAIVVAGLGVSSTLITLIYQRQREIGLLSLVGATPRQVRRVILAEAMIVGGVSQLLGIVVGIALALVLIFVINVQSFGWTIQFHLPLGLLVQSTFASWAGRPPSGCIRRFGRQISTPSRRCARSDYDADRNRDHGRRFLRCSLRLSPRRTTGRAGPGRTAESRRDGDRRGVG